MFEKSLDDLIRGIRSHKKDEQAYIHRCIDEIRQELRKDDGDYKAAAIAKLTYLQMLGYDFSWAAFHVVEVMASPNPYYKRIGYLAASQSFRQDTEVLVLVTNQIKKDLTSSRYMDVGVAISGLCQFLTPELAQFLLHDLLKLLGHSRPYIRKRATLALYKVFLKFPEGLRLCFPKLKEKLDDSDPAVVTAAVNVICELSRKSPQSYLGIVPTLYRILTESTNNWMLIKLVKLFAAITPLEPRLVKKLSGPLRRLIETTPAMSLLSECITTAVVGGFLNESEGDEARGMASICVSKLAHFLDNSDQNLKYVGLLALGHLQPLYPDMAEKLTSRVLTCLDDFDYSIRIRALNLASQMVTQNELVSTVQKLIGQLIGDSNPALAAPVGSAQMVNSTESPTFCIDSPYRKLVVESIITMCKRESYEHISSFEWYLAALGDLIYVSKVNIGAMIGQELQDVTVRVKSVRSYAVSMMVRLISDSSLLDSFAKPESNVSVLSSAAWIIGEYANLVSNPGTLLPRFYSPSLRCLSASAQTAYLQAGIKVFTAYGLSLVNGHTGPPILESLRSLVLGLEPFTRSIDLEVQERSCNFSQLLLKVEGHLIDSPEHLEYVSDELSALFSAYELKFVALKAQFKVPVPEDLNLDVWIGTVPLKVILSTYNSPVNKQSQRLRSDSDSDGLMRELENNGVSKKSKEEILKQKHQRRQQRKQRIKNDPFYIGQSDNKSDEEHASDIDSIPVVPLKLDGPSWLPGFNLESARLAQTIERTVKNSGRSKKTKKKSSKRPVVDAGEMPIGAELSDLEPLSKPVPCLLDSESNPLLSVDLSTPLKDGEKLPQISPYQNPDAARIQQQDLQREPSQNTPSKHKKNSKSSKSRSKSHRSKTKDKQSSSILIDLNEGSEDKATDLLQTKPENLNIPASIDLMHLPASYSDLKYLNFDAGSWGGDNSTVTLLNSELLELKVTFIPSSSNPRLQFHLLNSSSYNLENCELSFLDSPSLRLEGLDAWNISKLTSFLEPNHDFISPGLDISPTDTERLIDAVNLNGSLAFVSNSSRTSLNFQIKIPVLTWMSPNSSLSPEEFSNFLTSSNFPSSNRIKISRSLSQPITPNNAGEFFDAIVSHIAKNLGLYIVQSIDGIATSLYGTTVWDQPILGLAKHVSKSQPDVNLDIFFEFKASTTDLVDIFVQNLNNYNDLL